MTFLQTGQATTDPEFLLRVQAALFKLAQDVLHEADDTPGHAPRVALARDVVRSPETFAPRFVWLCAANPTIAASVTAENAEVHVAAPDSDIEFVCASNWDVISGWAWAAR